MHCPKCYSDFETLQHAGVEVDRCTGCGGIWLGAAERERLGAEVRRIDRGDPALGRELDTLRKVRCPRCAERMMRVADSTQLHVEYELCPACSGAYFDAGELTDLSTLSVLERFRKLVDVWLSVR